MRDTPQPTSVIQRWSQYWFQPVSSEVYAVLRVAFGLLCILDLLGATPISMFWDLDGLAPIPGGGAWGLRSWVAQSGFAPEASRVFFWGSLLAYSCMTLGIGGQASIVASFLANIWQAAWNVLPLSAAHQVLTVVLFCLIWADCRQALTPRRFRAPASLPRQPVGPLRLLQYQVCLIYFGSGLSKFFNPLWRDGSAIYYALSNNVFQRFPVDVVPAPLLGVSVMATYGTLAFELGFPLLVAWRHTRSLTLLCGVALHLGVWATLEVGPFSWVMVATYLAFVPDGLVATIDRLRGQKSAILH
jgi:hypothetical protein